MSNLTANEVFNILNKKFEISVYGEEIPNIEVLTVYDNEDCNIDTNSLSFDEKSAREIGKFLLTQYKNILKLSYQGKWVLEDKVKNIDLQSWGDEYFYTDETFSWVIFVCHESLLIIAGTIIEDIKKIITK